MNWRVDAFQHLLVRVVLGLVAAALLGALLFPFLRTADLSKLRDPLLGFVATMLGVLAAFALDRFWEGRTLTLRYAQHLDGSNYDLANLHAICGRVIDQLAPQTVPVVQFDAPAVRSMLESHLFVERAGHGLLAVFVSLRTFIDAHRAALDDFRQRGGQAAMVEPLRQRTLDLRELISFAQNLLDEEKKRIGFATVQTPRDRERLDRLHAVLGRLNRRG